MGTLITWRWYMPWQRFRAEWRRFKRVLAYYRRKRHSDFVNDICATRSKGVIGELPGKRRAK